MTIFHDKLLTRTDCDEAGDYVVPNVLSPRDLVFRPVIGHKLYHHPLKLPEVAEVTFLCPTNSSGQTERGPRLKVSSENDLTSTR